MKNNISIIIFSAILMAATYSMAYDNKTTHKIITETSVPESNMDTYLKQSLGMISGSKEVISGKQIIKWLSDGSYLEDEPPCRRSNHFHNPLPMPYYDPTQPAWSQSGVSDLPAVLDKWCWDWKPRYSNITWATGYLAPPPDGPKASFPTVPPYEPNNWDKARDYYYKALTLQTKTDRDIFFTWALKAVGQVLHLLQDVSVPAHVRNDFTSHLTEKNPTNPFSSFIQPFEYYVETHPTLVTTTGAPISPSIENLKLTDFWDANLYDGTSQLTGTNIGLAEFTNANYLSNSTILNNHVLPIHTFPYPNIGILNMSADYQICSYRQSPGVSVKYISRANRGACPSDSAAADHFAIVSLMNPSGYPNADPYKYFLLDDNVHRTYAKELLPRAVGYSAGLLNYFFRGNIEISLPDNGVYAQATGPYDGFSTVTLKTKNTTTNGDEMTDGDIQLVIRYRTALQDPFEFSPVTKFPGYNYIVASETTGLRSIPNDAPVLLTFDLGAGKIPWDATDITLQVVYHGRLGNEDGAVAVGYKDISEPNPIDIYNDMGMICLNANWYTAGSPEAIALVDKNNDGIAAGAGEWDVYPHDLDVYIRFSPYNATPGYKPPMASPTAYNFHVPFIPADLPSSNRSRKPVILTDYRYFVSYYFIQTPTHADDHWEHTPWSGYSAARGLKNQTEYSEDPEICKQDLDRLPPCYVDSQPPLCFYRQDKLVWIDSTSIVLNTAYPVSTTFQCKFDNVILCE